MANLPRHPVLGRNQNLTDIVKDYFRKGYTYLEKPEFLKVHHKSKISLSTLKHYLKKMICFRRPLLGRRINFNEVKEIIQEELHKSRSNLGYRRVWSYLSASGILLRRKDVRLALRELDPENVGKRQRRRLGRRRKCRNAGPNYVWYINGHDKLKPYGINIHGCIDGYSRRIIWLKCSFKSILVKKHQSFSCGKTVCRTRNVYRSIPSIAIFQETSPAPKTSWLRA